VERIELAYRSLCIGKKSCHVSWITSRVMVYRYVSDENVLKFGANVPVNGPAFDSLLTHQVVTQIKASERLSATTYYLQIREMAAIVALQIAWSVITSSRRFKVPEHTKGIANTTQSIEQIEDSLTFTRRKLYMCVASDSVLAVFASIRYDYL
jgi:hypothetical protein